jgi:D-glycero-D-manno-heptose 1,7-bisphosphate phosphatase
LERALFLDRDGILTSLADWGKGTLAAPRNWNEITFLNDLSGVEKAKALGFMLILVTNQPDVERGIIDENFVTQVNEKCREIFKLDEIYACVFSDNSHPMKKPNPGMLLKAASDYKLDLATSFFLGDTDKDVGAARNAGCKSILWNRPYNQSIGSDYRVSSLTELLDVLSERSA